jgi:hypothetical protein
MLNVVMLGVALFYCHVEWHLTECWYAECHYAECHYAECHYAVCHYAECHYAECRSAVFVAQDLNNNKLPFFANTSKKLFYFKATGRSYITFYSGN